MLSGVSTCAHVLAAGYLGADQDWLVMPRAASIQPIALDSGTSAAAATCSALLVARPSIVETPIDSRRVA